MRGRRVFDNCSVLDCGGASGSEECVVVAATGQNDFVVGVLFGG